MKKRYGWIWKTLYTWSSPPFFYDLSSRVLPWVRGAALGLFMLGLLGGLYWAPADYQQGDAFRIMYVHVPSAFLSLLMYTLMSFCAVLSLVWRIKLSDYVIEAAAPIGLMFTLLALVTGSIWGKPMWGTWWIWDARLTSEFILAFIYTAIIALNHTLIRHPSRTSLVAILTLVGFVDIPLIHYSVNWWNTLHQGATLSRLAKPAMDPSMLYPLLILIGAFFCYAALVVLLKVRTLLLLNEKESNWVRERLTERQA